MANSLQNGMETVKKNNGEDDLPLSEMLLSPRHKTSPPPLPITLELKNHGDPSADILFSPRHTLSPLRFKPPPKLADCSDANADLRDVCSDDDRPEEELDFDIDDLLPQPVEPGYTVVEPEGKPTDQPVERTTQTFQPMTDRPPFVLTPQESNIMIKTLTRLIGPPSNPIWPDERSIVMYPNLITTVKVVCPIPTQTDRPEPNWMELIKSHRLVNDHADAIHSVAVTETGRTDSRVQYSLVIVYRPPNDRFRHDVADAFRLVYLDEMMM